MTYVAIFHYLYKTKHVRFLHYFFLATSLRPLDRVNVIARQLRAVREVCDELGALQLEASGSLDFADVTRYHAQVQIRATLIRLYASKHLSKLVVIVVETAEVTLPLGLRAVVPILFEAIVLEQNIVENAAGAKNIVDQIGLAGANRGLENAKAT